jgi:preprotein translocase subunit SecG
MKIHSSKLSVIKDFFFWKIKIFAYALLFPLLISIIVKSLILTFLLTALVVVIIESLLQKKPSGSLSWNLYNSGMMGLRPKYFEKVLVWMLVPFIVSTTVLYYKISTLEIAVLPQNIYPAPSQLVSHDLNLNKKESTSKILHQQDNSGNVNAHKYNSIGSDSANNKFYLNGLRPPKQAFGIPAIYPDNMCKWEVFNFQLDDSLDYDRIDWEVVEGCEPFVNPDFILLTENVGNYNVTLELTNACGQDTTTTIITYPDYRIDLTFNPSRAYSKSLKRKWVEKYGIECTIIIPSAYTTYEPSSSNDYAAHENYLFSDCELLLIPLDSISKFDTCDYHSRRSLGQVLEYYRGQRKLTAYLTKPLQMSNEYFMALVDSTSNHVRSIEYFIFR